MEGLIQGACAQALHRHREALNVEFAIARRQWRRLDQEAFGAHVAQTLAPLVNEIEARTPGAGDAALRALYSHSLALMGRGLLGPQSRSPAINALWRRGLHRFARHLGESPREVAASLTNATRHLEGAGSLDPEVWLSRLSALAESCEGAPILLDAGQVLAWRLGMSHWRESALQLLATKIPEPIGRALLAIPETQDRPWAQVLRGLLDPWGDFKGEAPGVIEAGPRVGGFVGFGGPFHAPPKVHRLEDAVFVEDGQMWWSLHADRFGATLQRFGRERPDLDVTSTPKPFTVSKAGIVRRGTDSIRSPIWANSSSYATQGDDMVAITHKHSYHIRILAFRRRV